MRAICFANNECPTKRHRKNLSLRNQKPAAAADAEDGGDEEDAAALPSLLKSLTKIHPLLKRPMLFPSRQNRTSKKAKLPMKG
jgi:hypothetical protein